MTITTVLSSMALVLACGPLNAATGEYVSPHTNMYERQVAPIWDADRDYLDRPKDWDMSYNDQGAALDPQAAGPIQNVGYKQAAQISNAKVDNLTGFTADQKPSGQAGYGNFTPGELFGTGDRALTQTPKNDAQRANPQGFTERSLTSGQDIAGGSGVIDMNRDDNLTDKGTETSKNLDPAAYHGTIGGHGSTYFRPNPAGANIGGRNGIDREAVGFNHPSSANLGEKQTTKQDGIREVGCDPLQGTCR
jgi:hypothetical protein